jgi:tetratricopeptide (TPR) repeat protein
MEPTWTYPWIQMAYCYYQEKRLKEAVAVLEKAISKAGDKGLIYNRLTVLYYNLKDYRNSLRCAELARQNGNDVDSSLWNNLKVRNQ